MDDITGAALAQGAQSGADSTRAQRTEVSLRDLVENRLAARRQMFESQAMEAFRAGHYQIARDQLILADAAAAGDLQQRIYLRLWHVYACIAAQEYSQAINNIYWLLHQDAGEQGVAGADVLNQFRDVRSFYGQRAEYVEHDQRLMQYLAANRQRPEVIILDAMWTWGKGEVTLAKGHARRFVEAVDRYMLQQQAETGVAAPEQAPWYRFVTLFEEAERAGKAVPAAPALDFESEIESP